MPAADNRAEKEGRQTGRYKKVCVTDPDASRATDARNLQLEPGYNGATPSSRSRMIASAPRRAAPST